MIPISAAEALNRKTPIPTPIIVHVIGSLGVAGSVAVLVSQLAIGTKVMLALACVIAAVAVTLAHPYRKQMRAYGEQKNVYTGPQISMMLPLMAWWLLLMLAPLAAWPVWGVAVTFVVLFGAAWVLYPHVDGSRRLAYA